MQHWKITCWPTSFINNLCINKISVKNNQWQMECWTDLVWESESGGETGIKANEYYQGTLKKTPELNSHLLWNMLVISNSLRQNWFYMKMDKKRAKTFNPCFACDSVFACVFALNSYFYGLYVQTYLYCIHILWRMRPVNLTVTLKVLEWRLFWKRWWKATEVLNQSWENPGNVDFLKCEQIPGIWHIASDTTLSYFELEPTA